MEIVGSGYSQVSARRRMFQPRLGIVRNEFLTVAMFDWIFTYLCAWLELVALDSRSGCSKKTATRKWRDIIFRNIVAQSRDFVSLTTDNATPVKLKVKVGILYSAAYAMTGPARCTFSEVGSWSARDNGAAAQTAAIQSHTLTYNWTRVTQLANAPPLQSTTPGLHPVSIHQTSPLVRESMNIRLQLTTQFIDLEKMTNANAHRPTLRLESPAARHVDEWHGVHSFTCHPHVYPRMEWAILHEFRKHSPDGVGRARWVAHIWISLLLICRPRKHERLSRPSWLTCSGRFTHKSGHPSATGRAQDMESSPTKDRRSATVPSALHYIKSRWQQCQ